MSFDLTYQRATKPTTGPEPGAIALLAAILRSWARTRSLGIFNPRRIRGISNRWSIHAEGRAIDLGIPLDADGKRIGDEIAAWLVRHAANLGVQYIIWNGRSYKPTRKVAKWRPYLGVSRHRDHIHVELTRAAGEQLTSEMITRNAPIGRPRGTDTREGFQFPQHFSIENVISYAIDADTDAAFLLTAQGQVYAFPPDRYQGSPVDEIKGRTYEVFGTPDSIFCDGDGGYIVSTDEDRAYGYPVGG